MDVQTGLQTLLQVRPDVPGPYLAPKTAKDGAGASDAGVGVPDVLEAGNFVQKLVRTSAAPIRPASASSTASECARSHHKALFSQVTFFLKSKQRQQNGLCQEKLKRKTQPMFHSAFKNVNTESQQKVRVILKPGLSELRVD